MGDSTLLTGERWKGNHESIDQFKDSFLMRWADQVDAMTARAEGTRDASLITVIRPPVTNLDQNLPTQASVRSKPVLFFLVINPPQTGSISGSTNWLSAVSLRGEKLFCLIASVPLIVVFFLSALGCFFSICRYRYYSQINFNTCRSACSLLADLSNLLGGTWLYCIRNAKLQSCNNLTLKFESILAYFFWYL